MSGLDLSVILPNITGRKEDTEMGILYLFFNKLTHREKNATFDIPLLLVGFLFLIARLELLENQWSNVLVWTVVIFCSLITSLNYIQLLLETMSTIKDNIIVWKSLTIALLGIISSLMLLDITGRAFIMAMTHGLFSMTIFFLTAALRVMHCYLGGKANLMPDYWYSSRVSFLPIVFFFALVAPISKQWADAHASTTGIQLNSMIYCKGFLYLHWCIITFTFERMEELGLLPLAFHLFSLLYRTCGLVWIIWLWNHVSTQQVNPIQESQRSNQNTTAMVTGMLPYHPHIYEAIVITCTLTILAGSELVFPHVGYLL